MTKPDLKTYFILGGIVLAVTVGLISYLFSPYSAVTDELQLLQIGLSSLTSLLLIGIYAILVRKQDDQNELLSEQHDIMEANHEPLIQVLKLESYSEFVWPKMRNIGNGPLKDVKVKLHFHPHDYDGNIDTACSKLTHSDDSDALDIPAEEAAKISSLSPGETGKLAGEVRTPGLDDNEEAIPVGQLMSEYHDMGVEELTFQVEIIYDHIMGTRGLGHHRLKPRQIEVKPSLSIDSLISNSERATDLDLVQSSENLREAGTYYEERSRR